MTQDIEKLVNQPTHYGRCQISFAPADATAYLPHPLASATEYILRAGKKEGVPEIVDLKKAKWWLEAMLEKRDYWWKGRKAPAPFFDRLLEVPSAIVAIGTVFLAGSQKTACRYTGEALGSAFRLRFSRGSIEWLIGALDERISELGEKEES